MSAQFIQFAASLAAILFIAWLASKLGLGGDARILNEDHAKELADEALCGFHATAVALDKSGMGALLRGADGRVMLLRRHGSHFAGRILDNHANVRLEQNFLTLATNESTFGEFTLDLGADAQDWAASLRGLGR
ncbi:hypothetical protein [Altererythrobacter aquiaggeris]|uniref:hypothetical protein n=1 Tax=Aestuarierythrobacter aquiaggeris TaxID=1898396 RepID=UPI00301B52ED